MKLILVRHGETQWNKSNRFQGQNDVPLNRRGLAQARQTARSLAQSPCAAVYSSPLIRTMQAAWEISGAVGKPVAEVDGLKELNLGDLEGVTGEKMRADWPEVYEVWRANPAAAVMPNGESLTQLQARAWKSFLEVESAHQDEDTPSVGVPQLCYQDHCLPTPWSTTGEFSPDDPQPEFHLRR